MGSILLSAMDKFTLDTSAPDVLVGKYNSNRIFDFASMICGTDSSCDTDGDNHGCGCNA